MSEVKRLKLGENQLEVFENGPYVYFSDFDAQRLRADTAEAELERFRRSRNAMLTQVMNERDVAEQRIAEMSANNQQLRKLLEQTLASLNPTAKLSKSIRAAINPNPEAESHE